MNNESKTPRKEIIKTITIIFLSALLVLTLFSNTFMNYSLPQVSATYVSQGTISEQIRGSGTVEPAESYEVKFDQTREIKSVAVKTGQTVKSGDVLFELTDSESTELAEAQNTLDSLELEYEKALLSFSAKSGYQTEYLKIENAEEELAELKAQLSDAENKKDPLSAASDEYSTAKELSERLEAAKADYTAQLAAIDTDDMLDLKGEYYDRLRAAKDAVSDAEKKAEKAQKNYDEISKEAAADGDYEAEIAAVRKNIKLQEAALSSAYTRYYSAGPDDDTSSISSEISTINIELEELRRELSSLISKSSTSSVTNIKLTQAEQSLSKANKNLTAAKDHLSSEIRSIKLEIKQIIDAFDEKLAEAKKELSDAESDKTNAEAAGYLTAAQITAKIKEKENEINSLKDDLSLKQTTDSVDTASAKLDLDAKKKEIEKQREKVDKLKSESFDAVITAKMGGIVESLSVTAGSKVDAGTTAAVINVSDKGYTLEFAVKTEQARKVKAGDKAEITSWYWGDDFSAVLSEIRPDTQNPQTQKILVFTIQGADITTGQTITLSMGSKGQPYSTVVPNSAIREDSNGKFVLVMEAKSSPLGNRYKAVRYDIEVLAKDDNNTAVSGLMGSEFVITASTTPIAAGEQVRPAE